MSLVGMRIYFKILGRGTSEGKTKIGVEYFGEVFKADTERVQQFSY